MHEDTEISPPPGMFWIKLAGALAALAAAVFLARIFWDACCDHRDKAEPDEEAHLGI